MFYGSIVAFDPINLGSIKFLKSKSNIKYKVKSNVLCSCSIRVDGVIVRIST